MNDITTAVKLKHTSLSNVSVTQLGCTPFLQFLNNTDTHYIKQFLKSLTALIEKSHYLIKCI